MGFWTLYFGIYGGGMSVCNCVTKDVITAPEQVEIPENAQETVFDTLTIFGDLEVNGRLRVQA